MSDPELVRVLIADDHPVVRAGLQALLAGQPGLQVVGEAASGREVLTLVRQTAPDVLLLDLQMPEPDGVAVIRELRRQGVRVQVLVLTTFDTDRFILRAIEAGATGYLLKDTPREELFAAIRATARGQPALSPAVASWLVSHTRERGAGVLSAREFEVLRLVAQGTSNKSIAHALAVSEATVKTHLLHIFAKLGVDDRTAAVTVALERGILHLTP